MADYTLIQNSLAAELLITRTFTAMMERTGQTGSDYFRSMIVDTNCYDRADVEDARAIGLDTSHFDTSMLANLRAIFRNYRSVIQSQAGWSGVLAREINMAEAEKLVIAYILYGYESVNACEVSVIDRRGPLGALHKQMETDGQVIVSNGVSAAALTEVGVVRGSLDDTLVDDANNFLSHCHTGTLSFRCVNESTTAPQMLVTMTIAPNSAANALSIGLPDGTTVVNGDNLLTVNKTWSDGRIGVVDLELNRPGLAAPVVSNDDDTNPLLSLVSIATPYDGDCFKGQFFLKITRQSTGATWKIEHFADSGATAKVGGDTSTGTSGSDAISKTLNSGSVVDYTLDRAAAALVLPANGDSITITIDILTPRIGDVWTMAMTNSYNGKAATLISMLWPGTLPAVPAQPGACTGALAGVGAGSVDNGTHSYKITLVGPGGESPAGTSSNVVTVVDKTADGKIALTAIPVGAAGTGVTARKIYRTVAGNAGDYMLVATLSDNSTTIYTDNTADSALGADAPTYSQWDDSLFTAISIS